MSNEYSASVVGRGFAGARRWWSCVGWQPRPRRWEMALVRAALAVG
jgi:hypothetical protein